MSNSEHPYEDGAIYLVREGEGAVPELARWYSGEFYLFGNEVGFYPDEISVIARIEYSLRPI